MTVFFKGQLMLFAPPTEKDAIFLARMQAAVNAHKKSQPPQGS